MPITGVFEHNKDKGEPSELEREFFRNFEIC